MPKLRIDSRPRPVQTPEQRQQAERDRLVRSYELLPSEVGWLSLGVMPADKKQMEEWRQRCSEARQAIKVELARQYLSKPATNALLLRRQVINLRLIQLRQAEIDLAAARRGGMSRDECAAELIGLPSDAEIDALHLLSATNRIVRRCFDLLRDDYDIDIRGVLEPGDLAVLGAIGRFLRAKRREGLLDDGGPTSSHQKEV